MKIYLVRKINGLRADCAVIAQWGCLSSICRRHISNIVAALVAKLWTCTLIQPCRFELNQRQSKLTGHLRCAALGTDRHVMRVDQGRARRQPSFSKRFVFELPDCIIALIHIYEMLALSKTAAHCRIARQPFRWLGFIDPLVAMQFTFWK